MFFFFYPFLQEIDEEPANLNYDAIFQDKSDSWGALISEDTWYHVYVKNGMGLQGHWESDIWRKTEEHEYLASCVCLEVFSVALAVLMTQDICDCSVLMFNYFKTVWKYKELLCINAIFLKNKT